MPPTGNNIPKAQVLNIPKVYHSLLLEDQPPVADLHEPHCLLHHQHELLTTPPLLAPLEQVVDSLQGHHAAAPGLASIAQHKVDAPLRGGDVNLQLELRSGQEQLHREGGVDDLELEHRLGLELHHAGMIGVPQNVAGRQLPVQSVEILVLLLDLLGVSLLEVPHVVLDHHELEQTQLGLLLNLVLELVLHLPHHFVVSIHFESFVQPGMVEEVCEAAPLFRVLVEHASHELSELPAVTVVLREAQIRVDNVFASLVDHTLAWAVHKGMLEVGEAVETGPQSPDVGCPALDREVLPEDFRRMEHNCTLDVLEGVLVDLRHHSKVADLGVVELIKKDVLWLDVSVDQLVHKDGLKALEAVPAKLPELVFGESLPVLPELEDGVLLDPFDEFPILTVLHNDIEEFLLIVADYLLDAHGVLVLDTLHGLDLVLDLLIHKVIAAVLRPLLAESLLHRFLALHDFDGRLLEDTVFLLLDDEDVTVGAFAELVPEDVIIEEDIPLDVLAFHALDQHRNLRRPVAPHVGQRWHLQCCHLL